jgi:Rps23 Pro-64 3,4-dihydroxylase Tpa1-like proline 4-hydroxylase
LASEVKLPGLVNPAVEAAADSHATQFQSARPFRHLVIDNFLDTEFCHRVVEQFPSFDEKAAINEDGHVGGKAVQEKVRGLGSAFSQLDDLVQSEAFRALISRMTGIPDLQYDPYYFGGGTHENRQGQDLDAHIDFNYHPISRKHRRLNLIIYLNEKWDDAWGGSLMLHRDPYSEPQDDEIITVTPLMNRCAMFETNEHSWHGFERINLPEDKRHLSRKSFALYFYTRERPADEVAGEHSTVYVNRHLPERFCAGMTLSEEDLAEIRNLLTRRDHHLKRLYTQVGALTNRLANIRNDSVIEALKQKVIEFENSTSWRVTAPLRAIRRVFRRNP